MGRYVELVIGKGNLEGCTPPINAERAGDCERIAAVRIDAEFAMYDRTWWAPKVMPPEVQVAADQLASAEYIARSFASASQSIDPPASVTNLRASADAAIATAKARGWLLGVGGQKVFAIGKAPGTMFPEFAVELEEGFLPGRQASQNLPPWSERGPW